MSFFMLRDPFCDKGETPTRSLRSITKEHFATVGDLATLTNGLVGDAALSELMDSNTTKVQARSIFTIGHQRVLDVREMLRHVGADLVGLTGDRRSNERVHCRAVLKCVECFRKNALRESTPTGVYEREAT